MRTDLTTAPVVYCTICTNPIPAPRNERNTATCSEECKDKLDSRREAIRANKKCAHCLHPASPEERADFRRWRAERGHIRTAVAIPRDFTLAPKQQMRDGLIRAQEGLQEVLDYFTTEPVAALMRSAADVDKRAQEGHGKLVRRLSDLITKIAGIVDRTAPDSKLESHPPERQQGEKENVTGRSA